MIAAGTVAQGMMLVALIGLAVAAAIAAPLVARAGGQAERVAMLQLIAAKVVAACLGVAAAFGQTALIDAGLVLALLGAVGAAVFAQGVAR
jgi:multisubunit Na+/H+ antiporter MnhF subunit